MVNVLLIDVIKFGWLSLLDNIINAICLLFMSSFYSKYYDILCCCCIRIKFGKIKSISNINGGHDRGQNLTRSIHAANAKWTASEFNRKFSINTANNQMGTPIPNENEQHDDQQENIINFAAIPSSTLQNSKHNDTLIEEEARDRNQFGSIDLAQNAVKQYERQKKKLKKSSPGLSSTGNKSNSSKKSTTTISSGMTHTLSSASKAMTSSNQHEHDGQDSHREAHTILTLNMDATTNSDGLTPYEESKEMDGSEHIQDIRGMVELHVPTKMMELQPIPTEESPDEDEEDEVVLEMTLKMSMDTDEDDNENNVNDHQRRESASGLSINTGMEPSHMDLNALPLPQSAKLIPVTSNPSNDDDDDDDDEEEEEEDENVLDKKDRISNKNTPSLLPIVGPMFNYNASTQL